MRGWGRRSDRGVGVWGGGNEWFHSKGTLAQNSTGPDQSPQNAASDQDVDYLHTVYVYFNKR